MAVKKKPAARGRASRPILKPLREDVYFNLEDITPSHDLQAAKIASRFGLSSVDRAARRFARIREALP